MNKNLYVVLDQCDKLPKKMIDYGKLWGKSPHSLFLTGNCGTGKSTYARGLLREAFINNPNLWPRHYKSYNLCSELAEERKKYGSDRDLVNKLATCDLLILDEFGRESNSDAVVNQFHEIFDIRFENKLPTIVISNFNFKQLEEVTTKAIASRLSCSKIITFDSVDLRRHS